MWLTNTNAGTQGSYYLKIGNNKLYSNDVK